MSTAHTCFRSALTQAFRPSNRGTAASSSVAAFLVPALARPQRHHLSTGKRRSKEQSDRIKPPIESAQDGFIYNYPPKPAVARLKSCIPLPPADTRGDIQEWLTRIDAFLPTHLQRVPSDKPDTSVTVTSLDLALVINAAQIASLDILGHLGLSEGRWQTVVWMAKKLVEDGRHSIEPPPQHDHAGNILWHQLRSHSLMELTEGPIRIERIRHSQKLKHGLDDLTSAPDTISPQHIAIKRALGQLWRSLGNMILAGAEQQTGQEDSMPHVLEIIAHLHHVGFMPESVYTYRPHENKYALQQPPTLHMLSSKILTALSDASWKAHEASVKLAKDGAKVSYFMGHEIPGSRYKVIVTKVAPELWLELVLWSCLHGGWTHDGLAILELLASKQKDNRWGLISWREIILAEQYNLPSPSRLWKLFPMNGDAAANAADRARLRRTISSEVVAAFVDALVNGLRVGVGFRGADPEITIRQLKTLKGFLDTNNLSLGSAAWDSIMARLLDSGAFVPEKRPEVFLSLFELASGFGAEVGTANISATPNTDVPYFFEPTTMPLNLLHRTMRAFIVNGDIKGATDTLTLLQEYTDDNKQKSLKEFFKMLKREAPRKDGPFSSHFPPIDYPAFDTNLPVSLRAELLDLATDSKIYDLGRWFLFAKDIDGPLIGRDLYNHRNVAASIVRFGTLAGENDLVLDIVKRVGVWNTKQQQQRMPAEVFIALLCSQIKLRRWQSVSSMRRYITDTAQFRPRPIILSTFAAELLRLAKESEKDRSEAEEAFTDLLFAWETIVMSNIRNELYCVLAVMSTVDGSWKQFCSQFLAVSFRQKIKLSTNDFNQILRGVIDGYGSSMARLLVDTWCYTTPKTFDAHRAPGGLVRMPRFQLGKGDDYLDRPKDIELVQESEAKLVLQGRVQLNRQTVLAVLRQVQEEMAQKKWQELPATEHTKVRNTLRWIARLLHNLGYDHEDIVRDVGNGLAELAGLEAPTETKHYVNFDGADPDLGRAASRQRA